MPRAVQVAMDEENPVPGHPAAEHESSWTSWIPRLENLHTGVEYAMHGGETIEHIVHEAHEMVSPVQAGAMTALGVPLAALSSVTELTEAHENLTAHGDNATGTRTADGGRQLLSGAASGAGALAGIAAMGGSAAGALVAPATGAFTAGMAFGHAADEASRREEFGVDRVTQRGMNVSPDAIRYRGISDMAGDAGVHVHDVLAGEHPGMVRDALAHIAGLATTGGASVMGALATPAAAIAGAGSAVVDSATHQDGLVRRFLNWAAGS
jgi:hypothetical protein